MAIKPVKMDKQNMHHTTSNILQLLHSKRYAEFFAGIGLVRAGLEKQGWSISFANDIDPSKYQMYEGQYPDAHKHFIVDDIFNLPAENIPPVTLATASFPCKDLSLAGSLDGFHGEHSSAIWGFTRILENMKQNRPPIVMLENVTGFLSALKGESLKLVLQDLNDLGYAVDVFIMDAANFVPQSRQRMFIIGLLEEVFTVSDQIGLAFGLESSVRPKALVSFILSHPEIRWNIRQLPPLPANKLTLEDIVEDLAEDDPLWWNADRAAYLLSQMSPRHADIAKQMINESRWSYGTVFRRMRNKKSTAELRTDGIAGCLRTPAGGSAKQILFKAGYGKYYVRLITPRESARLMGADDFNITVSFDQALFGFGDAVCVPVIEWIARNYLDPVIRGLIDGTGNRCIDKKGGQQLNMENEDDLLPILDTLYEGWYAEIDKEDGKKGFGSICGGITIIENLLKNYSLDISQHRTGSGTQLRNQGISLGNRVMKKFNSNQRFKTGEFGRTSRGAPRAAERSLQRLKDLHLEKLSLEERNRYLNYLEEHMVRDLLLVMERDLKEVDFERLYTTERALQVLLETSDGSSSGAIAQHLVGAKLEMRFPDLPINNESSSAADEPTKRFGDFDVGDAAIHVTMSPQDAVYAKCKSNLAAGKYVYLLVPSKRLSLASTKAHKFGLADHIVVKSIESFVAQNIDEIAHFSKEMLVKERARLLTVYNRRVRDANERHAPYLMFENGELLKVLEEVHEDQQTTGVKLTNDPFTHQGSLFDLQD